MNNLISIIMPVYNSSKYLRESIQSVINQKYENWELICIDDGSTDDSLDILRNYGKKYHNIKVYNQENAGPAQARKLGIGKSAGEYISYLDSDDVYSKDYLYETLHQALKTEADVTMPILIADWQSNNEYNFNAKHNLNFGEEVLPSSAFLRTFPWSVHGLSLYKASHIKKYALTEISNVNNFNADEYLTRYLLLFANKIVISKGEYYYRHNTNSITRSFSVRQFSSLVVDKLCFELALQEKFRFDELALIAKHIFLNKIRLKKIYLNNFNSLNQKEILEIDSYFKEIYEKPYLKINILKKIKYYIFLKAKGELLIRYPIFRKVLKK